MTTAPLSPDHPGGPLQHRVAQRRPSWARRPDTTTDPAQAAPTPLESTPEPVAAPQRLRLGYGTNGMADHRLSDALALLADLGYDGVALTLDHQHLDPFDPDLPARVAAVAEQLDRLGLGVVIETGARYLLDPRRKHQPTLLSDDGAEVRLDLLLRAVRIGADLGAGAVSFWSGAVPPGLAAATGWDRLAGHCERLVAEADRLGVRLGLEPEPGMFVDTLDAYDELLHRMGQPPGLGLTLDIGHCRCLEPQDVPACVYRALPRLVHVQIDDMRRGVHEHLEFGAGEIDFPPVLAALAQADPAPLVAVELPRHSHAAVDVARRSLAFLRAAEAEARARRLVGGRGGRTSAEGRG